MNSLVIYFLKVNIALGILYSLYFLFFRNTTMHKLNRGLLLFILLFSAVIPFLQFNILSVPEPVIAFDNWTDDLYFFTGEVEKSPLESAHSNSITIQNIIQLVYMMLLMIMSTRFVLHLKSYRKLKIQSEAYFSDWGKLHINQEINAPFAFLKWIFIPQSLLRQPELKMIVAHEQVHAKQMHTLDLLLVELFCIAFWFNPFVFLLKRSLKTVHEFLADHQSIRSNAEKIEFLGLLASGANLNLTGGVSSNFYWSTLKKRINMITKNKTSRLQRLSYLLLIPAFGLVFMSFSGLVSDPSFISTMKITLGEDIPSIHPIKNTEEVKMTSGYGMRMHPVQKKKKMHRGIDFACPNGTPIVATADGEVVKMDYNPKGYGKFVIIKHNETFSTLYSQMSEQKVKLGEKVKKGQVIGLVGSSGVSTGPHLHYEIKKDGKNVDPADYIPGLNSTE